MTNVHQATTPSSRQPPPPLDVRGLRHPTEASRFALALVAPAAGTGLAMVVLLSLLPRSDRWLQAGVVVVFVVILVWVALQLWRVRMLADAVRVDEQTLPELHAVLQDVRQRLGFHRRVDVFVVDTLGRVLPKETRTTTVTSFFGVRVIVVQGSVIGDLRDDDDRRRCTFLMATLIGALKARHAQWGAVLELLQALKLTVIVAPLVTPWLRATVYTGDRLAYACCNDLDVSLRAAYRSLVGPEVAAELRPTGLVHQALAVRRSRILRFVQLLRSTPHVPNRYLALLAFAGTRQVGDYLGFRDGLEAGAPELDRVVARHQRLRERRWLVPLAFVAATALLLGSIVAAGRIDGGSGTPALTGEDVAATRAENAAQVAVQAAVQAEAQAAVAAQSVTEAQAAVQAVAEEQARTALLRHVPVTIQDGCSPGDREQTTPPSVAALTCPTDSVVELSYFQLASAVDARDAFDAETAGLLPDGDCEHGVEGTTRWSSSSEPDVGQLACFGTEGGVSLTWTDEENAVMVTADAAGATVAELAAWWSSTLQP